MEEAEKENMCAINLAGVYDKAGEGWRESVNAPNVLYTAIEVDGKKYALPETEPKSHEQTLDFYNAIHARKTVWTTDKGGAYGVASDTQVLKQADVVAMLGIFGKEYDKEILRKNFEYYEPRTEHGSSLSACMYSLLACQIGIAEIAYPFFMKSVGVDLKPGGKEWAGLIYIGGTHPASEGGAWIVAVKGFAGIGIENGKLVCNPCLPEKWKGMKFKLMFMDKLYQIEINKNEGIIKEI